MCRDFPRKIVHPTQPAQQRHDRTGVFGHSQDGRLCALLQQHRRQRTNHNTCGAQGDDRRVLLIQLTQGGAKITVGAVSTFNPLRQTVNPSLRVALLDTPRRVQAAIAQDDNGRCAAIHPCHRSPGTMISEK